MNTNQLLDPSETVKHLSLFAALAAGETCSIYATFVAHTLIPVSYRFVDNVPSLKAIYGRYQEIYDWDGLLFTLITSFAMFVLVWCAVRVGAWRMAVRRESAIYSRGPATLPIALERPPISVFAWNPGRGSSPGSCTPGSSKNRGNA